MPNQLMRWGLLLILAAALILSGCATAKKWVGWESGEEDDEMAPLETKEETVMIDGKPYVRSRNPYWLTYADQPEYIYVEKGK